MSSIYTDEELKCANCHHGEARHTANEVPRGRCEAEVLVAMGNVVTKGRCPCRRFQLQEEKP